MFQDSPSAGEGKNLCNKKMRIRRDRQDACGSSFGRGVTTIFCARLWQCKRTNPPAQKKLTPQQSRAQSASKHVVKTCSCARLLNARALASSAEKAVITAQRSVAHMRATTETLDWRQAELATSARPRTQNRETRDYRPVRQAKVHDRTPNTNCLFAPSQRDPTENISLPVSCINEKATNSNSPHRQNMTRGRGN